MVIVNDIQRYLLPTERRPYGVPDSHLPKEVLVDEIEKIKAMGVNIRTNTTVGKDLTLSQLLEENDAVLITTGEAKDAAEPRDPRS